jgi:hypothetical protein
MFLQASRRDFRDGKVFKKGDTVCWPIDDHIFVYVEGTRFGFLANHSNLDYMVRVALNPTIKDYMTREIAPDTYGHSHARRSTAAEIKVVQTAACHDFNNNLVMPSGSKVVLPLGHHRYTFWDKASGEFGFYFKPDKAHRC